MKGNWKIIPFEKCIEKVKYTTKIPTENYKSEGEYPIISQEAELISGYWDEEEDVFSISKPVVIFGDHTRVLKYVDFDFVLGADGVKILQPIDSIDAKYIYYFIKWHGVQSLGYSRHYKLLKEIQVPVPALDVQKKIVEELDLLSKICTLKKEQISGLEMLANATFYEMFGDPSTNKHGWDTHKLGDCFSYIKNGANIKQTKGAAGLPITRIETLSGGVFNRDRLGYADIFELGKYKDFVLNDGDLLLSHINSKTYIGRTVEYKYQPDEVIIHGMNLLRLIPVKDLLNSTYMVYYTFTNLFKENVARIRKDAVNQSSICISDLKEFDIHIPPLSLQQEFAKKIEEIESQKDLIKQSIKEVRVLLDATMEKYFG